MIEKTSPILGIIASKFTPKGPEPEFMIPKDLDPSISTTISIKAISTMAGESDEAREAISVLPFSIFKANGLVYFYRITDATARGGTVFASLTLLIHEIDSSFLYHNIEKLKNILSEKGQQIREGAPADIVCTEMYNEINEIAKYESSSRQILLDYGFDTEETDAYFYMVDRGAIGVGEIGVHLQIDRERALNIMKKLNEKGLIKSIPGKKLIYQALPPYRALLNQINTFLPFIHSIKETIPDSTDNIDELNKKYISSFIELENQIKKSLTTMESLFKSSKDKITFKFKNLWFIDGPDAMIAEITEIMWKAKIRILLVTPTIEDVNLSIIKNLPKKVSIRISTYMDFKNQNHLKLAKQLSEHSVNFRLYDKRNIWGVNRDQEEIIIGTLSKEGDVAAVATDVKEQIQMFAPILETAWIKGQPLEIKGIPLDLTEEKVKPTTSPFEEIDKKDFEKIEISDSKKLPKESPLKEYEPIPKKPPEIEHKIPKVPFKPILKKSSIFEGLPSGFQKIEEESTEKKEKKKKFSKTE